MEKSKTFKALGLLVGIKVNRKTQRGIVARKALNLLEEYELKEFKTKLHKIVLT